MHGRKIWKTQKWITILLALVFCVSGIPFTAAEPSAEENSIQRGDIVCFGEPDAESGYDGKWIVLDPEHTNMGTDGMFLVSLNLIGGKDGSSVLFRDIGDVSVSFMDRGEAVAKDHPGVTRYQDSDIQTWCSWLYTTMFSQAEQEAMIPTFRSDDAIVIPGIPIPLPGAGNGTVDFDPAPDVLNGDRVFIPSVEEIMNPEYGFLDNRTRVAFYKGAENGYWLRSPHIPTFPLDVGFVFPFGAVMDYPVNGKSLYEMTAYARPACNIDSTQISEVEKLSQTDDRTIWRIGFLGEKNARTYDTSIPVVGEVMDLGRMFVRIFWIMTAVVLCILALIVWLIIRAIRKRKQRRMIDRTEKAVP